MQKNILADRLKIIKPSGTLAINARALHLKASGRSIINLSVGEPDFDTPVFIQQAGIHAIQSGQTKYTRVDGTPELKAAIIRKFKRENNLDYSPQQITVGTGGKQVLYNVLMATLNPEDEVILPAPYWTSYSEMILLASGKPVITPCSFEEDFKLTPARLEAAITPRTKWLLLNSPSNPTGAVYTRAELEALGNVLLRYPWVHVLLDDIYEHLIYDEQPFHQLVHVVPDLYPRAFIVNGVSKTYAMTGWRIGYGAGQEDIIAAMAVIQSQCTSNPSSISQAAALAALDGDLSFLKEWKAEFQKRRDATLAWLQEAPLLRCYKPQGAFYIFVECKACLGHETPSGSILKTDCDVAAYLLEQGGVAVVPGESFGMENYFRLSFATSLSVLEEACQRMVKALRDLKPAS